jgi:mono/diheme cytochrome c family protein
MRARRSDALLVTAVLAIVMSGCARHEESQTRPEQVMDFGELFDENCAGCHGVDGRRGVAQPLNDPLFLAVAGDARLRDVVSRGVPGTPMAAFGRDAGGVLTNEQVRALVDGMKRNWGERSLAFDASLPAYTEDEAIASGVSAGNPERGRSGFASYCARCHGADGRGGTSAGSVVDEAFLALTSNQSLRTTIIAGHSAHGFLGGHDYMPGRPMTRQDISDVVAWLSAHRGNHD